MRSLGCLILACILIWFLTMRTQILRDYLLAPIHMVKGVSTGVELYSIKKTLINHYTLNQRVLPEDRFETYLSQEFEGKIKDPTLDPWRTPYRYKAAELEFSIWSAGPDRRFGTKDDLKSEWKKER